MWEIWPWTKTADTFVVIDDPGSDPMRFTIAAHCFTGHRKVWSVFHCVIVSDFLSFFWDSKVRETLSARWIFGLLRRMTLPSLEKAMFPRESCLVWCWSCFGTFRYSHDRQAKKKAPMVSWLIACWLSVSFFKHSAYWFKVSVIWVYKFSLPLSLSLIDFSIKSVFS